MYLQSNAGWLSAGRGSILQPPPASSLQDVHRRNIYYCVLKGTSTLPWASTACWCHPGGADWAEMRSVPRRRAVVSSGHINTTEAAEAFLSEHIWGSQIRGKVTLMESERWQISAIPPLLRELVFISDSEFKKLHFSFCQLLFTSVYADEVFLFMLWNSPLSFSGFWFLLTFFLKTFLRDHPGIQSKSVKISQCSAFEHAFHQLYGIKSNQSKVVWLMLTI